MRASSRTLHPRANFQIESDVKPLLARHLVAEGYMAVTPCDLHLWHASVAERLLAAAQRDRIVVTHNRKDFLPLHDIWRRWAAAWHAAQPVRRKMPPLPRHAGILIIPQTWQPQRAAQEIARFARQHPSIPDTLYAWETQRGWVLYP